MSERTPGTWTNNEHSTFVWSVYGNVCGCGDPHASGYVGYTECDIGSQWLGEATANARLIAAAPDMLAVLKQLHESASWAYLLHPEQEAVEEAIAKATQVSPKRWIEPTFSDLQIQQYPDRRSPRSRGVSSTVDE